MNILIWDQFGEDELTFYIVPDEHRGLLAKCHTKYINGAGNSEEDDDALNKAQDLMQSWQRLDTTSPFTINAAFVYISGFIP